MLFASMLLKQPQARQLLVERDRAGRVRWLSKLVTISDIGWIVTDRTVRHLSSRWDEARREWKDGEKKEVEIGKGGELG